MAKVSLHYDIRELVHPLFIEEHGVRKTLKFYKKYFPLTILGQENLRIQAGVPIVVNDYYKDNDYKKYGWSGIKDRTDLFINSGLRHRDDKFGSSLSGHMFGLPIDSKPIGMSPVDLQKLVMRNQDEHPYITRIENAAITLYWFHVQYGYRLSHESIDKFNP